RGIVARVLHEVRRMAALRQVGLCGRADVLDVDLRPVALVLRVGAAHLVHLAIAPVALAGLVPGTIRPGHEGDRAAGVAEATGIKRLAVARAPLGAGR